MTVYGADAVREAARNGADLHIGARDKLTPLGRELAGELGVRVIQDDSSGSPRPAPAAPPRATQSTTSNPPPWTPPRGARPTPQPNTPANPVSDPASTPPSPALYRRGAPLPATLRPGNPAPRGNSRSNGNSAPRNSFRVGRVIVVGAGHVGMIAAQRLTETDVIDEVVLVDIADGLAAGIALDLTHCAALLGFDTRVRGVSTLAEAGPADYVVITAGKPRQPGMSRSDLVSTNAAIVGELARGVAASSPDAVLLVVTNPLDEMTHHAWRCSGFPEHRVLGMAGVLDTARFRALVGLTGVARADGVDGIALGSHGAEMVVPLSQARANGRTLSGQLAAHTTDAIVERTRDSGAEVVGLLKSGSAFLAPGLSAARMVLGMIRGSNDIVPATVRANGQYGLRDVFVGLPVRLNRDGVAEIVELPLSADEHAALRSAAERITERVAELESTAAAR